MLGQCRAQFVVVFLPMVYIVELTLGRWEEEEEEEEEVRSRLSDLGFLFVASWGPESHLPGAPAVCACIWAHVGKEHKNVTT